MLSPSSLFLAFGGLLALVSADEITKTFSTKVLLDQRAGSGARCTVVEPITETQIHRLVRKPTDIIEQRTVRQNRINLEELKSMPADSTDQVWIELFGASEESVAAAAAERCPGGLVTAGPAKRSLQTVSPTIKKIVDSGVPTNRADLVFMGDGYTASEEDKFFADIQRPTDEMFSGETFMQYLPLFNIWAVFVPSNESGIGINGVPKDTAFGLYRDGTELRGVYTSKRDEARRVCSLVGKNACDYPSIIGNDDFYGGLGGYFIISTRSPTSGTMVLRHEMGHNFGLVGEEYDAGQSYRGANYASSLSSIGWKEWLTNPNNIREENGALTYTNRILSNFQPTDDPDPARELPAESVVSANPVCSTPFSIQPVNGKSEFPPIAMEELEPPVAARGNGHGAGDGDPPPIARSPPLNHASRPGVSGEDTSTRDPDDGFRTKLSKAQKKAAKKLANAAATGSSISTAGPQRATTHPSASSQKGIASKPRPRTKKVFSEIDKGILRLADCVSKNISTDEVMEIFSRVQRSLRSRQLEEQTQFDKVFDRAVLADCEALRALLITWFTSSRISVAEFKQRLPAIRLLTVDAKPLAPVPRAWRAELTDGPIPSAVTENSAPSKPRELSAEEIIAERSTPAGQAEALLGAAAPLRAKIVLQTAIEVHDYVHLQVDLPNTMKMHPNIGHRGILRQLINLTVSKKAQKEAFQKDVVKAQYIRDSHRVVFTFPSMEVASRWINVEIPLQGRLLRLELPKRFASPDTMNPAEYPITVYDPTASLSPLNMYHLFDGVLQIPVKKVTQASAGADGMVDPSVWRDKDARAALEETRRMEREESRHRLIVQEQVRMDAVKRDLAVMEREQPLMTAEDAISFDLRASDRAEAAAITAAAVEKEREERELRRMEREDACSRLVEVAQGEEESLRAAIDRERALSQAILTLKAQRLQTENTVRAERLRLEQETQDFTSASQAQSEEVTELRQQVAMLRSSISIIHAQMRPKTMQPAKPATTAKPTTSGKVTATRVVQRRATKTRSEALPLRAHLPKSVAPDIKSAETHEGGLTGSIAIDLDDAARQMRPPQSTHHDLDEAARALAAKRDWIDPQLQWPDDMSDIASEESDEDMDRADRAALLMGPAEPMEEDLEDLYPSKARDTCASGDHEPAPPTSRRVTTKAQRRKKHAKWAKRTGRTNTMLIGLGASVTEPQEVAVTLPVSQGPVAEVVIASGIPAGGSIWRRRRQGRLPTKRQLQVTDFITRGHLPDTVNAPQGTSAPEQVAESEDDVTYVGTRFQIGAPELVRNMHEWATFKAAMGLTEITTPGKGSCFYYSIYAMTHSTMSKAVTDAVNTKSYSEAKFHRDHLNKYMGNYLDELSHIGIIDMEAMCYRVTGVPEVTSAGVEAVRNFFARARKQPCHREVSHQFWAGENEIRATAHWIGVPIVVFDLTVDGRVPSATLYYPCPALHPAYAGQETVCQRYISVAEAAAFITLLKSHQVIPHLMVLKQSAAGRRTIGHFNALRIPDADYVTWAGTAKRRRDMRLRLHNLMQAEGLYPHPDAIAAPVAKVYDYSGFTNSSSLLLSSGTGSVYEPSVSDSEPDSSPQVSRVTSPTLRRLYGAGCLTDHPDEETKEYGSPPPVHGWYDADGRDGDELELVSPEQSTGSDDDADSVFSVSSGSSHAPGGYPQSVPSSPTLPLSQLTADEWAEVLAHCTRAGAVEVPFLRGYDKAVAANRLALHHWLHTTATAEPGLFDIAEGFISVHAACQELERAPGLLVDLLRNLPYTPVVFQHAGSEVLTTIGQAIFDHGRWAMVSHLSRSSDVSAEVKRECKAWLTVHANTNPADRWTFAQSPDHWDRIAGLLQPSATLLRSIPGISDDDWGRLMAFMLINAKCLPLQIADASFADACAWLLSATGTTVQASAVVAAAKAFGDGDWTAPLALGVRLRELTSSERVLTSPPDSHRY